MSLALFSGDVGPAWAARADRPRAILYRVAGGRMPPGLVAVLPDRPSEHVHPRLGRSKALRPAALEAAEDLVDGLLRRRFGRLEDLLTDDVWTLWPGAPLGRYARAELVASLSATEGQAAPYRVVDRRSYSFIELRQVLARGLPELMDAVFEIHHSVMVSFDLEGREGRVGRQFLWMSPQPDGAWRAQNLPLGSPDDAAAASASAARHEDEVIRIADRIVRRVVLGQAAALSADRNALCPRLWIRDELGTAQQLVELVAQGDHRLGSAEVVFTGSREVPLKALNTLAGPKVLAAVERQAPDVLGRSLHRLDPRAVITELAVLDPGTGEVMPAQQAGCLLIRERDALEREDRRIAAVII